MGYRAYHALVTDVAAHARSARRTGLTDQVLCEPPRETIIGPRTVVAAAAVLIVMTWALVG
jgi:hypothetical protein